MPGAQETDLNHAIPIRTLKFIGHIHERSTSGFWNSVIDQNVSDLFILVGLWVRLSVPLVYAGSNMQV